MPGSSVASTGPESSDARTRGVAWFLLLFISFLRVYFLLYESEQTSRRVCMELMCCLIM